ncbi:MAG: twin-arginine translocation signal domain-containing protein, partial [Nocardioidaceae bacterium]
MSPDSVSRRAVLQATAAAVVTAALPGCSGDRRKEATDAASTIQRPPTATSSNPTGSSPTGSS